MNKLEVGMYARTTELYGGLISHITKVCEETKTVMLYGTGVAQYPFKEIQKASHNIIDLIEVGDVITTNNLCGQVTCIDGDKIYTTCYDGECCYNYQIQSIVTKEQFSSMEYRLGE